MKKAVVLAAILPLLSACASPAQLRSHKMDIDEMTNRPAERVAGCVGDEFEKFNVSVPFGITQTFATRPTSNGYSITGIQSNGIATDTIILVDIVKTDAGSHVTMFDNFIVSGGGKWAGLVRGCL